MELGNSSDMHGDHDQSTALIASFIIVAGLLVLLCYLICLRRSRLNSEEWLEEHKHMLYSHAKNIKSEGDILKSLVDHIENFSNGQHPRQVHRLN